MSYEYETQYARLSGEGKTEFELTFKQEINIKGSINGKDSWGGMISKATTFIIINENGDVIYRQNDKSGGTPLSFNDTRVLPAGKYIMSSEYEDRYGYCNVTVKYKDRTYIADNNGVNNPDTVVDDTENRFATVDYLNDILKNSENNDNLKYIIYVAISIILLAIIYFILKKKGVI